MTTPQQHPAPPQQAPQFPPQGQPQGYWPGQAPAGGYVSPIPVRKATLGGAIASEWTKIRSVRSTMWTLGVMVTLVLGIGLLAGAVVSGSAHTGEKPDTPLLILGFYGVLLGTICVITLGVLTISTEYGTGLIRTTLTACPDRGRVLTAKAIVFFLLVFGITLVCTTLVSIVDSMLVGDLVAHAPSGTEWLKATVGVSLYLALLGLLALAVGTLLRHSAGAITVMLGVMLLPLVLAMFMFSSSLADVRQAMLVYSVPNQLAVLYSSGASNGISGWTPLWIMLGLAAAGLLGAYASLVQRDS
ncbi:ABC-type transport system involved in multi-copper enzyme maturation permease subunit [Streptomyces olivoverticillatus]|uniref:ABC-type transport system involved in multi-copper enzyme maturation permease subunit n=1 Tax=Streptomyces olivoverticillatus TaxID=66427 RepID=A0A7W7LKC4_9ACTN|nr:ABC transporter permease [Streptomyces olivoverticillatus]MBB4891266.1 ABC-type transport system involved in multi-copper enzyme maturation permease subunit [Streptomyces olivoverticillatus]